MIYNPSHHQNQDNHDIHRQKMKRKELEQNRKVNSKSFKRLLYT